IRSPDRREDTAWRTRRSASRRVAGHDAHLHRSSVNATPNAPRNESSTPPSRCSPPRATQGRGLPRSPTVPASTSSSSRTTSAANKASTKRSGAAGAPVSKRPTLPIYRSPRRSGCASSIQPTATTAANSSPGKVSPTPAPTTPTPTSAPSASKRRSPHCNADKTPARLTPTSIRPHSFSSPWAQPTRSPSTPTSPEASSKPPTHTIPTSSTTTPTSWPKSSPNFAPTHDRPNPPKHDSSRIPSCVSLARCAVIEGLVWADSQSPLSHRGFPAQPSERQPAFATGEAPPLRLKAAPRVSHIRLGKPLPESPLHPPIYTGSQLSANGVGLTLGRT